MVTGTGSRELLFGNRGLICLLGSRCIGEKPVKSKPGGPGVTSESVLLDDCSGLRAGSSKEVLPHGCGPDLDRRGEPTGGRWYVTVSVDALSDFKVRRGARPP